MFFLQHRVTFIIKTSTCTNGVGLKDCVRERGVGILLKVPNISMKIFRMAKNHDSTLCNIGPSTINAMIIIEMLFARVPRREVVLNLPGQLT